MRTESEKSLALIDTNILVYAYAESAPNTQKAVAILSDCFSGKTSLAISLQNIGEFCDVALRKRWLEHAAVQKIVGHILDCTSFVKFTYTQKTLPEAIVYAANFKIGFWDAMLAATMLENGVSTIYTENTKDFNMPWIKAINPFLKQ